MRNSWIPGRKLKQVPPSGWEGGGGWLEDGWGAEVEPINCLDLPSLFSEHCSTPNTGLQARTRTVKAIVVPRDCSQLVWGRHKLRAELEWRRLTQSWGQGGGSQGRGSEDLRVGKRRRGWYR